ncbi:uncharacterized protein LOC110465793 [Mizuhopecten yessoensis]|uniref:Uncharacterized protein n=1 Tax=Mizuhopecten yessoensis TaxID=6573 RepID=A0A210PR22_MIZYE|nr:uncharacterized protein LOC110465793 [Mizuhopecten yessoensis]OWF38886.1 hypothetical protein KP79_PYT23645 [Mizuhopecten yessoensis]
MADKSVVALVLSMIAVAFLVGAFASPYWVESFQKSDSRFIKAGLWEFCFNDYTFWKDYNGNRYKGCWYIFSDQYRPIWEWLSPHWFMAVQVMVSVALLFLVITTFTGILAVCHVFPEYLEEIILLGCSLVKFVIVIIQFIVLVLFGVQKEDRQWVPRPDQNFLSWSYGLFAVSTIMTLAAAVTLLKAGLDLRKKLKEDFPRRRY